MTPKFKVPEIGIRPIRFSCFASHLKFAHGPIPTTQESSMIANERPVRRATLIEFQIHKAGPLTVTWLTSQPTCGSSHKKGCPWKRSRRRESAYPLRELRSFCTHQLSNGGFSICQLGNFNLFLIEPLYGKSALLLATATATATSALPVLLRRCEQ